MPRFRTATKDNYTTYSYYVSLLDWICVKSNSRIQRILDKSWDKVHGNQ